MYILYSIFLYKFKVFTALVEPVLRKVYPKLTQSRAINFTTSLYAIFFYCTNLLMAIIYNAKLSNVPLWAVELARSNDTIINIHCKNENTEIIVHIFFTTPDHTVKCLAANLYALSWTDEFRKRYKNEWVLMPTLGAWFLWICGS